MKLIANKERTGTKVFGHYLLGHILERNNAKNHKRGTVESQQLSVT